MSGYRENNFDPAGSSNTRPARPFNWAQWTGVALIVLSVALNLVFISGAFGWIPKLRIGSTAYFFPMMIGFFLINSRREPTPDLAPELASDRRRWMIIVVSICAVLLGIATIFAMKGY